MKHNIEDLLELAKKAALEAYEELLRLNESQVLEFSFSNDLPREMKSLADQVIEKVILRKLQTSGLSILTEESGEIEGNQISNFRFIIDPIDGTVNFIRNLAPSSISIALYDGIMPIFGVILVFPSGDLAWGGRNFGAFLNNKRLKVSNIGDISHSVICTGFPSRFQFDNQNINDFITQIIDFGKVRMLGAASLSLLQVAKGSAEVYLEEEIMIWDVAAGIAIVEGSGGHVSILPGKNKHSHNVIASNGLLKYPVRDL